MAYKWYGKHLTEKYIKNSIEQHQINRFANSSFQIDSAEKYCIWDNWLPTDPYTNQIKNISNPITGEMFYLRFFLAAPRREDMPMSYYNNHCTIHWAVSQDQKTWQDQGSVFKNQELAFGARQWTGSTIIDQDLNITLFYTITGEKTDAEFTFSQSIAEVHGKIEFNFKTGKPELFLDLGNKHQRILESSESEIYAFYQHLHPSSKTIMSYRDPFYFYDQKNRKELLVFTGKTKNPDELQDGYNACFGIAEKINNQWIEKEPLLISQNIASEMEVTQVIFDEEQQLYYLFFNAQKHTFHSGSQISTGLFGFVTADLFDPNAYQELNETGIAMLNPTNYPEQNYAFRVLPDKNPNTGTYQVTSHLAFVNLHKSDMAQASTDEYFKAQKFTAKISQNIELTLKGNKTMISCAS